VVHPPLVLPGLAIPRKLSCPMKKKNKIFKGIMNDEMTDFANLNDPLSMKQELISNFIYSKPNLIIHQIRFQAFCSKNTSVIDSVRKEHLATK
jgi:hypothetical protein